MKRIYLITAATLILSALILAYSQTPRQRAQTGQIATTAEQLTVEKQASTQQRINRYFHGDAMSKIKSCWSNIQGKGNISLKYTYTKSGGRWAFAGVEVEKSSLASDQAKVALRCMSDSMRASSFPVESTESSVNTFILKWNWPVPFPANATQLTSAMFAAKPSGGGSGGGGCDGHGAAAKCYTCVDAANGGYECKEVCVGHPECTITVRPKVKICSSGSTLCASGGPFGVVGTSRIQ